MHKVRRGHNTDSRLSTFCGKISKKKVINENAFGLKFEKKNFISKSTFILLKQLNSNRKIFFLLDLRDCKFVKIPCTTDRRGQNNTLDFLHFGCKLSKKKRNQWKLQFGMKFQTNNSNSKNTFICTRNKLIRKKKVSLASCKTAN